MTPPRSDYIVFGAGPSGAALARRLCERIPGRALLLETAWSSCAAIRSNLITGVSAEQDLFAYIRQSGQTSWHLVGTCKMGNDAMAVVDSQLRVRGISSLRVVDSSIMPTIPASNTNAASIMIGEKAAALILGNSVAEFRSLADGAGDRAVMRADRARGGELSGPTSRAQAMQIAKPMSCNRFVPARFV